MASAQSSKPCDKCATDTPHRFVKSARERDNGGYWQCATCSEENSKRHRRKHWFRYLAQKANARQRAGSEKLTEADLLAIWSRQGQTCALSKMTLNVESKWWKPSLDRIDSSKGYTKDNVRVVAWIINHCRLDLTDEEFLDMCRSIAVHETTRYGFLVGYD